MQIQGFIVNIVPDGGYQSQAGYIYTFQMSIQDSAGTHIGQIGSKTQVYPLAIGQPIIVEMTNSAQGVRFKKINPKFAQQSSPTPPPQKSKQPIPQAAQADDVEGKVRHGIICAYLSGGNEPDYEQIPFHFKYIMTGLTPTQQKDPRTMPIDELLSKPASYDKEIPSDDGSYGDRN